MSTVFGSVPEAPPDAIFGVATRCNASPLPKKHLLSVGVYRTEEGKPYVFPAVSKAEDRIIHKHFKDYLPMDGYAPFIKAARELLWDDLLPTLGDKIASIQSCAGTGALYIIAKLAQRHMNFPKVLLSNPMWPNYRQIFGEQGHDIMLYPWAKDCRLDLEGALDAFRQAPEGSLVVLQACAHNPTGIDPTEPQWQQIFDVVKAKKHIVCFDFAYMGYASGDINQDAKVVRDFARDGNKFFVSFSFSKCLGLYGERIGCVHAVCDSPAEAKAVGSQFAGVGRATYSVCPQNGAFIVTEVLNDPVLKAEWLEELKAVTHRVINIRNKFCDLLEQKTGQSWDFIRQQKGMFALTGLSAEEVGILGDKEGVFIPNNGRISVPALNNSNVEAIAQAVANVVALRK